MLQTSGSDGLLPDSELESHRCFPIDWAYHISMSNMAPDPWARFRNATLALEENKVAFGLIELTDLFSQRRSFSPEFAWHIGYSYGVALLMAREWSRGLRVLRRVRAELNDPESITAQKDIAMEMAAGHIGMGHFRAARKEAQQAIAFATQLSEPDPRPYFHMGKAELGLKRAEAARLILLKALEVCAARFQRNLAAKTCMQLAHCALQRGRADEAITWADYAYRLFLKDTPHVAEEALKLKSEAELRAGKDNSDLAPEGSSFAETLLADTSRIQKTDAITAMDIDLWAFLESCGQSTTQDETISIAIGTEMQAAQLYKALVSDVITTEPHPLYPNLIANTFVARLMQVSSSQLPDVTAIAKSKFEVLRSGPSDSDLFFSWTADNPWPKGLAPMLCRAAGVFEWAYHIGRRNALSSKTGWSDLDVLSTDWRVLPRRIYVHYAASAEFEAGGSFAPCQVFERLVREVGLSRARNVQEFVAMGYSPAEAEELSTGGFLALRASRMGYIQSSNAGPTQGFGFGGVPVDEIHGENQPTGLWKIHDIPESARRWGWLVDSYYQAPFWGRVAGNYALYGARNDFFDRFYDECFRLFHISGLVRAKHHAIPIIDVNSLDDIHRIVRQIPRHPSSSLVFRGQNRAYPLKRTPLALRLLFGRTDITEPSLLGTAPRQGLDYELVHSALQCIVQDHMYEWAFDRGQDLNDIHRQWEELALSRDKWDIAVMALAQHYGIPTNGIDVTSSADVGVWFATNEFERDESGSWYRPLSATDWSSERNLWPVLYVIQPIRSRVFNSVRNIEDLTQVGINALRPQRQSALFFMGADTIDRNRLAESLVCVLRLGPGLYDTGLSYSYLFPSAEEDAVYRSLLNVKAKMANRYLWEFFRQIEHYRG